MSASSMPWSLLRLLNLAPVLVLEAIWIWVHPLAVMRTARRDWQPVTECDCVRSYAAPDPPNARLLMV
jgi:hypothetical protein